mmetsp:Transcript_58326/g.104770  ORF Transcript_58326/g.104770 Transcript_58326/m.104770 type:complete len:117 (-) Transcript_58326:643-993(-)
MPQACTLPALVPTASMTNLSWRPPHPAEDCHADDIATEVANGGGLSAQSGFNNRRANTSIFSPRGQMRHSKTTLPLTAQSREEAGPGPTRPPGSRLDASKKRGVGQKHIRIGPTFT